MSGPRYECVSCGQTVKAVHIPDRFMSPSWVHVDGYEECRHTYASPNFSRPVTTPCELGRWGVRTMT